MGGREQAAPMRNWERPWAERRQCQERYGREPSGVVARSGTVVTESVTPQANP